MLLEAILYYIYILAFTNLLKYENKRSISEEKLKEYVKTILNNLDKKLINITINSDIEYNFDKFIKYFNYYFRKNNNTIVLFKNVNLEDLKKLRTNFKLPLEITYSLIEASLKPDSFATLKINSMKNMLLLVSQIEIKLEPLFLKLAKNSQDEKLQKEIKNLLFMRYLFLKNLEEKPVDFCEALVNVSNNIYEELSEFSYDVFPLDIDLYTNSIFYNDEYEAEGICDRVYDLFQYAIFGKSSLAHKNMFQLINSLYKNKLINPEKKDDDKQEDNSDYLEEKEISEFSLDEENLPNDNEYEYLDDFYTEDEIELMFYLTFIRKLSNYMKLNGETEDLLTCKGRLLYCVSSLENDLYDPDLLEDYSNAISSIILNESDYESIRDEALFMAHEIFINQEDEYTLKKLLFISSYFELTNDPEIIKIIGGHFSDERYAKYCAVIFADEKEIDNHLYREK